MKKLIILLLLLFGSIASFAQRDALYSQYIFNYHILNPAFSGSLEKLAINLVNRNQWVGINGAPHTITFSTHMPIRNDRIALGVYVYTDKLGPYTNFGFISTYAYRVKLKKGKLSLGLQMGVKQSDIDWDVMVMEEMGDIYLLTRPQPRLLPDANFGIYYSNDNFFAGFSSKHLFERAFVEAGSDGGTNFSSLSRHFYTYLGGFLHINKRLVYKPSVLIKFVDKGTFSVDFNSSIMINDIFWVGISYRTNKNSLVFLTEIKVSTKLKVGYSYDTYLGDIRAYNIGTHEFFVGYEINPFDRVVYRPYYF